jgi:hypothetical protein
MTKPSFEMASGVTETQRRSAHALAKPYGQHQYQTRRDKAHTRTDFGGKIIQGPHPTATSVNGPKPIPSIKAPGLKGQLKGFKTGGLRTKNAFYYLSGSISATQKRRKQGFT